MCSYMSLCTCIYTPTVNHLDIPQLFEKQTKIQKTNQKIHIKMEELKLCKIFQFNSICLATVRFNMYKITHNKGSILNGRDPLKASSACYGAQYNYDYVGISKAHCLI